MRLSVSVTPESWSRATSPHEAALRTIEQARLADAAGIDTFWVSEDPDGWDAIAILAAAAVQTERIRLATSVVNPFYRHPSLIAASISTIDRLSGGRARLGLGRGQTEWYGAALGMEVSAPLARLEETISLLRQWWDPPHEAESHGPIGVQGWRRSFGPIQNRPPIYLAAAGKHAVALAGRAADGIIFNDLASVQSISTIIHAASAAARDAGRNPGDLEFIARPRIVVTDEPEREYERIKNAIAIIYTLPGMGRLIDVKGFDVEAILADVRRVMKTDEIIGKGGAFLELREGGDLPAARKRIPDDLVANLAMIGTLGEIRPRIAAYAELGVSEIAWRVPDLTRSLGWEASALLLQK